jgi:4-diphosphocytidyl-2-C-methyl-D-erythritol kinase
MESSWILQGDKNKGRVTVWSPAKINLYLIICGRLPSGYHKLRSLMVPVTLADKITLETGSKKQGVSVQCNVSGIPTDSRNLTLKAVRELSASGISVGAVHIRIDKKIPAGAGLGGGSSNAAAVLKGLDWLYGLRLPNHKLRAIGQRIGADIPFFFKERACVATGIGEILRPARTVADFWLVIGFPGLSIPTSEVYKTFPLELTNPKARVRMPSSLTGEGKRGWHLINDLEKVVFPAHPSLKVFKMKLLAS